MANKPLREYFHYLVNQFSGISFPPQSFFLLCRDDPDRINILTKNELSKVINSMEAYYKKTLDGLVLISGILSKTAASESWTDVKASVENKLKDINERLILVKQLSEKISDSNFKADIINISKEMSKFHEKCESACRLIDGFKDKLLLHGIYDNIYDEKGEIVMKILAVDDEQGITDILKEFFENRGFAVTTVNDGESALAEIEKQRPDIVFLDIRMKGMSGLECLANIKKIDKSIRVIMITVHEEDEIVERAKELGADEYITKPFRVDYLEEVVIKKVHEMLKEKKT